MKEPILIVGAGPAGLSLALELSRHKVPVRIIDKETGRHHESRSLALHSRTLEIFEKLGVVDAILNRGKRVYNFKVYLKDKEALDLDFSNLKAPYPFICMLPQNETEEVLIEELVKYDVHVERQTKLLNIKEQSEGIKAFIRNDRGEKESITTPFLIGCDGASSSVRRLMKIPFKRYGYVGNYLLADVLLSWDQNPDALRRFQHPSGAVTVIPIKDRHYRIMCDLEPNPCSYVVSETYLKKVLLQRVPEDLEVEDIEWMSDQKLSYREAEQFRSNRVFLAGDAAHLHSPIGGQGLNLGIQDVFNLGWKLAYITHYHVRTVLLASYSRERKPVVQHVLKTTRRLTDLAAPSGFFSKRYQDLLFNLLNKTSALKLKTLADVSGLGTKYKKSSIVKSQKKWLFFIPSVKAGSRFLDGDLINPKTRQEVRLFSLIKNTQHHLFIFCRQRHLLKAKELLQDLNTKYSEVMGVHLISPDEELEVDHYWIDQDKEIAKPYRLGYPFMILVRPDGYIGLTAKGFSKKKVDFYFQTLLSASF